ncbi:hypothetical protein [Arthrobacter sp. ISL-28]|nr:hypothetical protein [Arthrobacter sp. ISL-28]
MSTQLRIPEPAQQIGEDVGVLLIAESWSKAYPLMRGSRLAALN